MNPESRNTGIDTSLLEKQQQQCFFNGNDHHKLFSGLVVKPDPGMENGWVGFDGYMNKNNSISVSVSASASKKRKADKGQILQIEKEKRIKECVEEGDSKEASTNTSCKEKSEVKKPDYIHVRARRGQATDSHSLAERVRREKISERMKYLQDLVPGCNKIMGKAGMLDEIINYVQSLQKQVEFLSMKLATVNPGLDFNIGSVFTKEMFQSPTSEFPTLGCSSETANSGFFQLNSLDQVVSYCGLDMGINTSAELTFMDSSCFNQMEASGMWEWDGDLENAYKMENEQGRFIPFQFQQFTGSNEGSNLKMGM